MSIFLIALMMLTPPSPASADAKGAQGLDGKWVLADGRANGQNLPEGTRGRVHLIVSAGEMIMYTDGGGASRFVCKFDANSTPNLIDLAGIAGRDNQKHLLGIYELKDDRLKVCRTLNPAIERPKEFAADAGSKRVIEDWKRDKDDYTVAEDRLRLAGRWRVVEPNANAGARLRDLDFNDPMLNVTSEQGGQQLAFASGPWQIVDDGGVRKITGPVGACTYNFDKGKLAVEFADGRFKGKWTLTRTRTP
jgi:uncharacterized protein (TIGR03067 family)